MSTLTCPKCNASLEANAKFCTSCGTVVERSSPQPAQPAQEERVPSISSPSKARKEMSKKARTLYATGATLLFAFFLYIYFANLPGRPHPVIAAQPEVSMASSNEGAAYVQQNIASRIEGDDIVISLLDVKNKKLAAFDYQYGNTTVPLVAFITAEGKLVTAVRLCEPCNSQEFRIEGTTIVCAKCGTQWDLNNLEGLSGNCQKFPPDPIPSKLVGNEIHISQQTVRNWKIRM